MSSVKPVKRHPARTTVFVPNYAMSGGTLIAGEVGFMGRSEAEVGRALTASPVGALTIRNLKLPTPPSS